MYVFNTLHSWRDCLIFFFQKSTPQRHWAGKLRGVRLTSWRGDTTLGIVTRPVAAGLISTNLYKCSLLQDPHLLASPLLCACWLVCGAGHLKSCWDASAILWLSRSRCLRSARALILRLSCCLPWDDGGVEYVLWIKRARFRECTLDPQNVILRG